MSALPRILAADDDHTAAVWRNLVIVVWQGTVTLEAVRGIRRAFEDLARDVPGTALFAIVEPTALLPSAEVRRAVASTLADPKLKVIAALNVLEGEGFRAAAVRAVVTGIDLLLPARTPNAMLASVERGAAWIVNRAVLTDGPRYTMAEAIAAVETVRACPRSSPSALAV